MPATSPFQLSGALRIHESSAHTKAHESLVISIFHLPSRRFLSQYTNKCSRSLLVISGLSSDSGSSGITHQPNYPDSPRFCRQLTRGNIIGFVSFSQIWTESEGCLMNCLLRYCCLFRPKSLCPLASCRNGGNIFGCGYLNLSTVLDTVQSLNGRSYGVFLTKNMPLHRAPVIESFRLELWCSCLKPKNMNTWVLAAVSHCLRELEIVDESYPSKPNTLPSNLFTCKSLVVLKLDGDILLDVPRMVSLPSLKTLRLEGVRYFNDQTLQRLLSNSPVLEDLVVFLHDHGIKEKLTLVVPSLQSLTLSISSQLDTDGFVIETPNLKYFDVWDKNGKDHYCLIENMPNLIEANLDFYCPDINSIIGSITSVKRLTICSQTMLNEGFVFNQLEHLEVCLCTVLFSDQLVRLLKASSKLKRLDISLMDCHYTQHMGYWNQPTTVPECLLSSLQSLSWSTYTGEPQERDGVVYILKHALHLKTATIKSYESDVPKYEMLQELSFSSRASAACQLIFECASED